MVDDSTISKFLRSIKTVDEIIVIPTDKNRRTRYRLGITIGEQEDMIRNLTKDEYIKGPVDDHDVSRSSKLWVFKHNYNGTVIYIKITEIEIINDNGSVRALSCHIDNML
ncbi:MAG: hypothetical protein PF513_03945 [Tenericutes bacterium]|jgi:hypothetical protein|nr:hypothetical protein [Mycoplasmatota bacterium]